MDFASSFVDSDNLLEEIGSGNLGTSQTRKTCESSAHWECRGQSGPDTLPQSGHQGLVVVGKELKVLPTLAELSLQTISLENAPLLAKSLIAQDSRGHTLSFSLASITHSRIATTDECLIDSVKAVIRKLYPSLPSRIPIQINLINSVSAHNKSLLRNCSSRILSIAKD